MRFILKLFFLFLLLVITSVGIFGLIPFSVYAEVPPPIETVVNPCIGKEFFIVTPDGVIIDRLGYSQSCKITEDGEKTTMELDVTGVGKFVIGKNNYLYGVIPNQQISKFTLDGFHLFTFVTGYNVDSMYVDHLGNIYVAETRTLGNNDYGNWIYKFNEAGILLETYSLGEKHYMLAEVIDAIAVDESQNIFFVIRGAFHPTDVVTSLNKLSPDGTVTVLNPNVQGSCAQRIVLDAQNNIYCGQNKFDSNGNLLFTFDSNPDPSYQGLWVRGIDASGKIYTMESGSSKNIKIFRNKFIEDNIPPVIDPVNDILVEATSSSGNSVTFASPSAMDAIDGAMDIKCSPESGSTFPVGTSIPVTCTSTDYSFNSDYVTFDVKVVDSTPPVISSIQDIISTSYLDTTKITYSIPTATDAIGISGSVTCDPPSNTLFPIGTTIVTCSVSDTSGNIATSSFLVKIQRVDPPVDNTPPIINIPNNIAVGTNVENSQPVSFSVTATDDMDGTVTPTCTHNSGSNFSIGTTIVTCSVSDHAGNSDSKSFTVTINFIQNITPDYLPTRDDIGYEWQFPTNKQVYNELEDSRGMYPDEYPGFAEYSWRGYMKGGGYATNFLDLYVYRFLDLGYAEDFYEDHVDYWKGRGGFSNWTPSSDTVSSDECFGREVSGMTTDKISLYCIKNEIVVFVTTTGFAFEMTDELSNFADSVFDKIPNNSQTSTPAESVPAESVPADDVIDPEVLPMDEIINDTEYKIELFSNESKYQTGDVLKVDVIFSHQEISTGQYLIKDDKGNAIISKTFVPRSNGMYEIQELIDTLWESGEYTLEVNWEFKQKTFSFFVQQDMINESNAVLDSEPVTEKVSLEPKNSETKPKPSFVDESKDPQSYVDRYNNEASYKEWFDENYPDYTIEEAVGLPESVKEKVPTWVKNNAKWWSEGNINDDTFVGGIQHLMKEKIVDIPDLPEQELKKDKPSFVDESKDPQSYVDRYNNEEGYKTWFDENYSDYTIEEAVGITTPIPDWIKNTAIWWADGAISEDEFLKGIEFLVEKRILNVN